MIKNIFAIFTGIIFCFFLLLAGEIFFVLNAKFSWIAPLPNQYPSFQFDEKLTDDVNSRVQPLLNKIKWISLVRDEDDEYVQALPHDHSSKYVRQLESEKYNQMIRQGYKYYRGRYTTADRQIVIYDVDILIDPMGRRATPAPQKSTQTILLFGDSFTFGEGVQNNETSAYYLSQLRPQTTVWNLGRPGGGAGEVLYESEYLTKNYMFANQEKCRFCDPPNKKPILVYTYIDHHMERLICRSSCVGRNQWMMDKPHYAEVDRHLVYKGSFYDRTVQNIFYKFIDYLEMTRFFNVVLPPRFTKTHFKLMADAILQARQNIENRIGEVDFYFSFYPTGAHFYLDQLKTELELNGIKWLDYTKIDAYRILDKKIKIPGDGHPTPYMHALYATLLDRELPKAGKHE